MPELPEVETVRRGLAPIMVGAVIARVEARRKDLRFPLPEGFSRRLSGARVDALDRRGKYLIARLSNGESLVAHLGMSGRFMIVKSGRERSDFSEKSSPADAKHNHVIIDVAGRIRARIVFNDPRRFGFLDIVSTHALEECRHFKGMGPEPLSNAFSAEALNCLLAGKKSGIKTALLDQRNIAGLGNIYVSEALYRARISPRRKAKSVAGHRDAKQNLSPACADSDFIAR